MAERREAADHRIEATLRSLREEDLVALPPPPSAVWDAIEAELDAEEEATRQVGQVLAQIQQSDLELIEPPPGLWERIEGAIAAESVRPAARPSGSAAPPPDEAAGTVIEYWIDGDDVLVRHGGGWAEFARRNDAPEVAALMPARTLWSYMADEATREVWQIVVERVRTTQRSAQVPLRCDAPEARRWFTITVTPSVDGRVHFRSVLTFEEPRSGGGLLDRRSPRDPQAPPVPLCSWCGRAELDDRWLELEEFITAARVLEEPSPPPIAHGICGACREEMSTVLLDSSGVEPAGD